MLAAAQRIETANANAAHRVESDAIDGGIKHTLIRGELLQGAHPRAGAHDGHQVARLHLLVHEFLQRATNARDAIEGEAEVVDNQRDQPPRLLRDAPVQVAAAERL